MTWLRAILALILALLAAAVPADDRIAFPDGRLEIPVQQAFVPIQPYEYLPFEQKQGPPLLLAQARRFISQPVPDLPGCIPQPRSARPPFGLGPISTVASFCASLQATLVPERAAGSSTPTFTRATAATHTSFEGVQTQILSGEARFQGARRVANLIPAAGTGSASLAVAANKTVTVGVGTFVFSMGAEATGTGVATFTGTATGSSGTLTANATSRTAKTLTITGGGTIIITASVQNLALLQLENVTGQTNQNPSSYVSVGVASAPYFGAGVDGVQYFTTLNGNTVASNVVTEATGAAIDSTQAACAGGVTAGVVDAKGPLGYLPEGVRINNALWSRDLTNAAWAATNVGTARNAVGVDGAANTATTLTATAGNGTVLQAITLASQANVFQPFVKRLTGTGVINITVDGGTTWTPITINSSTLTQVQVTKTAANPSIGFQIVTNTDAIIVDMADMQNDTFASTPIPTTTVAVQRNGDQLYYASLNNIFASSGSSYAEIAAMGWTTDSTQKDLISTYNNNGTNIVPLWLVSGTRKLSFYDGTGVLSGNVFTGTPAVQKVGSTWSPTVARTFINGAASVDLTSTPGGVTGTRLYVGGSDISGFTAQPYSTIRFLKIYPTALSSPKMQALTTDATSWLGDPWWNVAANDPQYRLTANGG